ncbi:hypothetical protein H7F33_12570 [Pedobacter sp. PAMC26386]|nr:hypothetical protein H7F33_12570 [Pedobacter sp. PAMC26386]
MKKNHFNSFLLACLLLTASCTQHKPGTAIQDTLKTSVSTAKDLSANKAGIVNKPDVSTKKSLKTDTVPFSTNPCSQIAYEILTTSDRYKSLTDGLTARIIANGGTSYGLFYEGSPNAKKDNAMNYSKTYDYAIHESYPDHSPVTARFTFDPTKRQLFEYDAALDSLIPTSFNKNLLLELDKACK